MTKTVWLVDVAYVVKASQGIFKLDYVETERFLAQSCGPARTFLFNGYDESFGVPDGLQAFYEAMERYGMQVRLHPMQSGPPGSNQQRRVDVDLSAHLVWQASVPEVEALVLTTGDQDFIPAVKLVQEKFGQRVILLSYDAVVHRELAEIADEHWLFEDHQDYLERA